MKRKWIRIAAAWLLTTVSLLSLGCDGKAPENKPTDVRAFASVSVARYADLADAAAKAPGELGARQALYFPAARYTVTADLRLDCPVQVAPGAVFEVAAGCTLTFADLFTAFDVQRRLFTGDGKVLIMDAVNPGYADWFCDGTEDDTAYLQKGVDALYCLGLPDKTFVLDEIVIDTPTRIVSAGGMQIPVTAQSTVKNLFTVRSGDVTIQDLLIDMDNTQEGSAAIFLDTSAGDLKNINLTRIKFYWCSAGVIDTGTAAHGIDGIVLDNLSFHGAKDTQIVAVDNWKNVRILEVEVTRRLYGGHTGINVNVMAYIFRHMSDVFIQNLDVNGEANRVNTAVPEEWYATHLDGSGMEFTDCHNVSLNRCLVEYVCGGGFWIKDCSGFRFEDVQVFTHHNSGFVIENLTDSQLNGLKASPGADFAAITRDSFIMKNCRNVTVDGLMLRTCHGNGLYLESNEDLTFNNVNVLYNVRLYGLYDAGGNKNVQINGFSCKLRSAQKTDGVVSLTGEGVEIRGAVLQTVRQAELKEKGVYA